MIFAPPLGHGEGQYINRPPLFNGHYYASLKARMEDFQKAQNYELWMTIINGYLIPMMKDDERKFIPKPNARYGEADYRMLAKNAKAKYILVCGLGPDKFNRISRCTTAK